MPLRHICNDLRSQECWRRSQTNPQMMHSRALAQTEGAKRHRGMGRVAERKWFWVGEGGIEVDWAQERDRIGRGLLGCILTTFLGHQSLYCVSQFCTSLNSWYSSKKPHRAGYGSTWGLGGKCSFPCRDPKPPPNLCCIQCRPCSLAVLV